MIRNGTAIAIGKRVVLREPVAADCRPFLAMVARSRATHRPWLNPPRTPAAFQEYLERYQGPGHQALFVFRRDDESIVGVFTLSQIARGALQSAFLGYYADRLCEGQGYMTEGLGLVLRHVFKTLKLHRLEANIQPANARSIRLVQRCGFHLEGFSPRYLKINNRWRDHERWAILVEDWRKLR